MNTQENVVVTGSGGLLGRRICRRLAERYAVFGLELEAPDQELEGVTTLETDLTDDGSVSRALDALRDEHGVQRIAAVVHLAAHYDFSGEPSPLYKELSVEGTRRLLHGLRAFDVERFVFASSILAMRPACLGQLLDEQSPEHADWAYPQSKLDVEKVLRTERGELPVTVLRVAGCYDEMGHSIPVAQQIHRIHKRSLKSWFFPGNADHGQAFVHVEDVARCVRLTVDRREVQRAYDLYLVAEPACMSYRDLQEDIGQKLHGREWATLRVPGALAKAGAWIESKVGTGDAFIRPWMIDLADAHYPVDIRKAREELGWEPLHRLPDTLDTMLERLQQDPERWYRENGLDAAADDVADDVADEADDDDDQDDDARRRVDGRAPRPQASDRQAGAARS